MKSICSIVDEAAAEIPDKPLFVFPENRWRSEEILTYGQLASRSLAAARTIAEHAKPGQRALVLFPTGAAFWEAFVGCLASGVIAVPLNIPNLNRGQDQLQELCHDCTPSLLLTDEKTAELLSQRAEQHPDLSRLTLITPDRWRGQNCSFDFVKRETDSIAFLQYTSGSTSSPKGVQISHTNLLANLEMIRVRMGIRLYDEGTGVTWLPHYHDMGLVGSYLETLFTKNTTLCLQPEEFVLQPVRWLQLLSEHRTPIGGGPDFAYRLCVEKIKSDELELLDLSAWRVAYIGAERIRSETLRRFSEKFAPCGFRNRAFFPCYGLGEATLMATGGPKEAAPVVRHVSSAALMANRIEPSAAASDSTTLVGSGKTFEGSSVMIIELETKQPLADKEIGEVCLSGPSITHGYFNRKNLNEELFIDMMVNGRSEKFLRTGDLGFLSEGELFITGRIKEIIIVRGRNLYPEDIEQLICNAHQALSPDGAVAFSAELDGQESLVIAAELLRSAVKMEQPESVFAAVRQRIMEAFGVSPSDILLLRPASIPRTRSGKPRRVSVRDSFINGTLDCLHRENT